MPVLSPCLSRNQPQGAVGACLPPRGFTLVELVVLTAIAAILVAVAVPGMKTVIDSNRATSYVNTLVSGLYLARSEAVKRNKEVIVCASINGVDCGGSWNQGWVVMLEGTTPMMVEKIQRPDSFELDTTEWPAQILFLGDGTAGALIKLGVRVGKAETRSLTVGPAGTVKTERVGGK